MANAGYLLIFGADGQAGSAGALKGQAEVFGRGRIGWVPTSRLPACDRRGRSWMRLRGVSAVIEGWMVMTGRQKYSALRSAAILSSSVLTRIDPVALDWSDPGRERHLSRG
jgi:hypothetical protein